MAYDWLTASTDVRAELYRACKRVVDGHYLGNWSKFYDAVFGPQFIFGQGYEDNFRKGLIARAKAAQLARWLSIHHTREAEQLAIALAALGEPAPLLVWQSLLHHHGITGQLTIIPFASLGIVGLATKGQTAPVRVRLGEEFCLRLRSGLRGQAIAFQRVGGLWYMLPLADDRPEAVIDQDELILPRASLTGEPLPLSDAQDGGAITFALVIGAPDQLASLTSSIDMTPAVPPSDLDMLAEALLSDGGFELHCAELVII